MAKKKVTTYTWDMFFKRLQENIFRPKRQTKDILFRLVFGDDRQALLQLYNALHGTAYTNPHELQIVTLDNAIYISRKNDLWTQRTPDAGMWTVITICAVCSRHKGICK